jgi:uncharacterized protein YoxC
MTIASEVKQCLASLKGVEASLSSLAQRAQDNVSKRNLHESMLTVNEVAVELEKRIGVLEREELQYKGF